MTAQFLNQIPFAIGLSAVGHSLRFENLQNAFFELLLGKGTVVKAEKVGDVLNELKTMVDLPDLKVSLIDSASITSHRQRLLFGKTLNGNGVLGARMDDWAAVDFEELGSKMLLFYNQQSGTESEAESFSELTAYVRKTLPGYGEYMSIHWLRNLVDFTLDYFQSPPPVSFLGAKDSVKSQCSFIKAVANAGVDLNPEQEIAVLQMVWEGACPSLSKWHFGALWCFMKAFFSSKQIKKLYSHLPHSSSEFRFDHWPALKVELDKTTAADVINARQSLHLTYGCQDNSYAYLPPMKLFKHLRRWTSPLLPRPLGGPYPDGFFEQVFSPPKSIQRTGQERKLDRFELRFPNSRHRYDGITEKQLKKMDFFKSKYGLSKIEEAKQSKSKLDLAPADLCFCSVLSWSTKIRKLELPMFLCSGGFLPVSCNVASISQGIRHESKGSWNFEKIKLTSGHQLGNFTDLWLCSSVPGCVAAFVRHGHIHLVCIGSDSIFCPAFGPTAIDKANSDFKIFQTDISVVLWVRLLQPRNRAQLPKDP